MTLAAADDTSTIRALTSADLGAVVAIDAAIEGRPRRAYVERRLAAALREPALHAQFAACRGSELAGYILARVLEGEFGRSRRGLRLEMVGVRADMRGRGAGRRLADALVQWAARHGVHELHTAARWRDAPVLRWLDAVGFDLAPSQVLGMAVDRSTRRPEPDAAISLPPRQEVDFGAPQANDFERRVLDQPEVRAMTAADLREVVRIDRSITGRDRSAYMAARMAETMSDSPFRVSLAARLDGAIVGYLMARADLGDYGRAEPVAVIDTLGVDAGYARRGVGRALLSQLFANLEALQVERVETVVAPDDLALRAFFQRAGLMPTQRLAFWRALDSNPLA
jgi:ribosomal protein S18 acetylase RimI-like enzyme